MSTKNKILFIDSTHPYLIEELERCGFICVSQTNLSYDEYCDIIHEYVGIVIRSRIRMDSNILSKAENLKFIGRVGAGLDNIDVEYATQKEISCLNAPEGNRDALAEHTVGMLLALFNHLCRSNKEVREGIWRREQNRGIEIMGKTIGIIGYGNMGGAFAKRVKGFDVNVIAYDKYKTDYSDVFCTETTLDSLMEQTDILSIHVPLTHETTYMVDNDFINRFKKDIYIINTSRGMVLKTEDLLTNIDSGKVRGAALDVIEYEDLSYEDLKSGRLPDTFNQLVKRPGVIFSPHIAGWTVESKLKLAKVLVDKIKYEFGL